jgi:hypothetical protein
MRDWRIKRKIKRSKPLDRSRTGFVLVGIAVTAEKEG